MAASGLRLHWEAFFGWRDDPGPRERLWTALAQCSVVHRLQLDVENHVDWKEDISLAERQLLASINCGVLILDLWGECCEMLQPLALLTVQAEQVYCKVLFMCDDVVAWSALTAHPGCYVLLMCCSELRVTGCPGHLPGFAKGWALTLVPDCFGGKVPGLPLEHFLPGPRGHLVWRNSAVSEPQLESAYEMLQLDRE